jgi:chloramphenicol 3-O-phosphotransferase
MSGQIIPGQVTPGQIIIVNGASGSGKSTTCETFARHSDDFWLCYGIDDFIAGSFPAQFGHHGPRSAEGIYAHPLDPADPDGALRWSFGPNGIKAFHTLHEWLAAASRSGVNMILDHFMLSDPPLLQDCIWTLADAPVLLVTLKPPYEVLRERIENRAMTKKIPTDLLGDQAMQRMRERLARLRGWFYDATYANEISDLTIDTTRHSPEEVAAMIEARLKQGPGTAFAELRRKWSCRN